MCFNWDDRLKSILKCKKGNEGKTATTGSIGKLDEMRHQIWKTKSD